MWSARKWLILGACLVMLAGLGWLDYLTGYEMGLFIFYSLPVGIATWYLGRWPGLAVSVASALTWWLADRTAGQVYSSTFLLYWNNLIHIGCFFINALTINKTRQLFDRQLVLETRLREQEADLARFREAESSAVDPLFGP